MQTKYFRINKKEYCHITNDVIFVFNSKTPDRIPLEHELGEGWGIMSVLNYLWFTFLFVFVAGSASLYGMDFFKYFINYGAIALLFLSLARVKNGFVTSRTPTISRSKIKSIIIKSPMFSFPRMVIYFEGPEGKLLRKTIPILYKQEAIPVLQEVGLIEK